MRMSRRLILAAAACTLCAMGLGYATLAADAKQINLVGGAIWNGNKHRADFKAALTPTGDKQYDVVYTVTWDKATTTWKGTMKGELKNGVVEGTGVMPNTGRTFIFQAKAVDGVLIGKHWETTGGKKKLTGDIGLKPG